MCGKPHSLLTPCTETSLDELSSPVPPVHTASTQRNDQHVAIEGMLFMVLVLVIWHYGGLICIVGSLVISWRFAEWCARTASYSASYSRRRSSIESCSSNDELRAASVWSLLRDAFALDENQGFPVDDRLKEHEFDVSEDLDQDELLLLRTVLWPALTDDKATQWLIKRESIENPESDHQDCGRQRLWIDPEPLRHDSVFCV